MHRWLDIARLRLRSLMRQKRVESELDRELRAHLEQQVQEYVANGMSQDEARYAALRSFGGVEQVKEDEPVQPPARGGWCGLGQHDQRLGSRGCARASLRGRANAKRSP